MPAWLPMLLAALAFGPVLHFLGHDGSHRWRRLALIGALLVVLRYVAWRLSATVPWGEVSLSALYMQAIMLLELAWLLEMTQALSFFWAAAPPAGRAEPAQPPVIERALRRASVDVFIPTYNEGPEILERTIVASRRIAWSGPLHVHVLDDGRRAWVGELCERLGARWITRPDNRGAKAGNINHALGRTDGDFILFLDADFLAHPDAVARLMPSMEDDTVAIAQAPQHFYNDDPVTRALGVQRHLSDEQAMFFDRILPARDRAGFAFFCGTCALVRRQALVEAGGLPTDAVTEDILLSVYLSRRGWHTRYVDQPVAVGLAPESMQAFYVQRRRWGRGAIQLMYLRSGLLSRGLGLARRLAFLPLYWTVAPVVRIASLVVPQGLLLFGWQPLQHASDATMLSYQGPVIVAMMGVSAFVYRGRWSPLVSSVWADLIAIGVAPSLLRDLVFPFRDARFHVTPKGRAASAAARDRRLALVVTAGVALTLASIVVGASRAPAANGLATIPMFWAVLNLLRLLGASAVLWRRGEADDPRVEIECRAQDGFVLLADRAALPLAGWLVSEDRLRPAPGATLPARSRLGWRGPDGRVRALAAVEPDGSLSFGSAEARARMLSALVGLRVDAAKPYRLAGALGRTMAQMLGLARSEKPA